MSGNAEFEPAELEVVQPSVVPAGAELDLVCNEYVLEEKMGLSAAQNRRYRLIWRRMRQLILPLIIGVVAIAALLFGMPILSMFFMLGCLGMLGTERHIRGFPTNVTLGKLAIRFSWKLKSKRSSPAIPYTAVVRVDAHRAAPVRADDPLRGVVVSIAWSPRLFLTKRGVNHLPYNLFRLGTQRDPDLPAETRQIGFPLDSLTLDADRQRFLYALKEKVSPSAQGEGFIQLTDATNQPTYTQLWLDDMQSFRRQRTEDLESGMSLNDRYQIVQKIATGGQSKIYAAKDLSDGSAVAIKELVLPINAGAEVRNRSFANVKTEAVLLERLKHPSIIRLLDTFVQDHRAYLVLEHVSGKTLRRLVQDEGAQPPYRVCNIGLKLCSILIYLHQQEPPIVHRDFTPDNVMLSTDGAVKLLDFNVAKQLEADSTKTVVGKHNYMPPEQFRGNPRPQSDLYALGCTLYFLLTGEDPVPLSCSKPAEKRTEVPPQLDQIVRRLTALELSERYESAEQVESNLEEVRAALDYGGISEETIIMTSAPPGESGNADGTRRRRNTPAGKGALERGALSAGYSRLGLGRSI